MTTVSYKRPYYMPSSALVLCIMLFGHVTSSEAQVGTTITPTTTGPNSPLGLGTVAATNGNTTVITGGTRVGPNLFHSFDTFNVGTGAVAQFQNSGSISPPSNTVSAIPLPPTIFIPSPVNSALAVPSALQQGPTTSNIFARVIGGQSQIDGTIQTVGFGSANLWFMNPSGIIFGPHAQLNVGGSATFTTADTFYLRDSAGRVSNDGPRFTFASSTRAIDLNNLPNDPLHVYPVASFGFFGSAGVAPKPITITESTLSVPAGKTLSLVAGDIGIIGGKLSAPNGAVKVSSVGALQRDVEISPVAFVNVDQNTGFHSYSAGTQSGGQPTGLVTLAQSAGGVETNIDTVSTVQIQLNGILYNGSIPSSVQITNGSLQVANLPSSQIIVASPAVTGFSPAPTIDVGGTATMTVTLNHAYTSPVTVQLKSDNSNVASIAPAAVTIPAKSNTSSQPQVHGVALGKASVSASVGNSTPVSAAVQVTFPPPSSLAPNPLSLTEGEGGTVTVTLARPAPQAVTVTFTSSNPSVVPAPPPITIAANQSTATASFSSLQQGAVTLTASLVFGGQSIGSTTTPLMQINPIPLSSFGPNISITEGNTGTLTVVLAKQPPHPVTVSFQSSNPNAVPPPSSVTIQPNQTQIPVQVQGVHDGSAIITASYASATVNTSVQVNLPQVPPINSLSNLTLQPNSTGTLIITLANPSSRDVRVALNNTDGRIAQIAPFVTVPANQTSARIPVQGISNGITTITASDGTSTTSATVQVTPPNAPVGNAIVAGQIQNAQTGSLILPSSYAKQIAIATDRCARNRSGELSSFVQRGREGAPLQPGQFLSSPPDAESESVEISSLTFQPSTSGGRFSGLNLVPGVAAFLNLSPGC